VNKASKEINKGVALYNKACLGSVTLRGFPSSIIFSDVNNPNNDIYRCLDNSAMVRNVWRICIE
jgi:hypothetical protein